MGQYRRGYGDKRDGPKFLYRGLAAIRKQNAQNNNIVYFGVERDKIFLDPPARGKKGWWDSPSLQPETLYFD